MRIRFMSVAAFTMLACVWTLSASAQQTTPRARADQNQIQRQAGGEVTAARLDEKTGGATIRASKLMGMDLQNDQGQSVGEINDLVLDANTGRVRYAAVTYGGFLGLGDKLFAVPFEAFKVRQDPDDADDYVMVLNVTKEQLEGAQGFDEDHWPDMANTQWAQELDKRYGVDRTRTDVERSSRGVGVDVDRRGVDVDINRRDADRD